ncbi:MAG: hypothetical protein ACUZ8O_01285 [Candidatus Anammoxibacter sp.]
MNRKQYSILVVLVIVSGLVGGGMSNWIFKGEFAFAKKISNKSLLPEHVVTTEELRIVGKDGMEHITMGINKKGEPRIVFWNVNNRKSSIVLGLNNSDSPALTFWDRNGKSRVTLVLNDNGDPKLRFIDKNGIANSATLGITSDGEPELALYDKMGKKRAKFSVTPDETTLDFIDDNGNIRIGFGMLTKGSKNVADAPVIYLDDEGEKSYWEWVATK